MSKQLLRSSLLKKRSFLSLERKKEASLAAFEFLKKRFSLNPQLKVLSFASKPFEINLWPLNLWLMEQKRLLLPKTEKDLLAIYEVTCPQELCLSSFNIQEPNSLLCKKVDLEKTSFLILVPALGFDTSLHRLGYGKGHYDRFLAKIPKIPRWGIGFKEQQCEPFPIESHDLPMDELFLF